MSFPATYNIQYYMGDTFEFRIFPKDASGAPFPLAQFPNARFTIAEKRGPLLSTDNPRIEGFAQISNERTSILCSIRPSDAANLDASTQYVYDVEISRTSTPYDEVFTLLTGNISITDQITPATTEPETPLAVPLAPTVDVVGATDTTITIEWTPPQEGETIDEYDVFITPNPQDPSFLFTDTVSGTTNDYTFTGLTAGVLYYYSVVAKNEAGASSPTAGSASGAVSTESEPPASPDFAVTNDGSGAYLVDGISNDTITLVRGESYIFEIDASGHPFWIQTVSGAYSSENIYSEGITGNGTEVGTLTWDVSLSAPDTLYYACQFHSSMQGTINIIDGES